MQFQSSPQYVYCFTAPHHSVHATLTFLLTLCFTAPPCAHIHTHNYSLTGPQLLCCSHSCTFYVSLCYDAHKILHTHCLTALYSQYLASYVLLYAATILKFAPPQAMLYNYTYTDYYATHLLPHGTSLPSATYPTIHCSSNTTIVSLPLSHTCVCGRAHTHTHSHTSHLQ